MPSAPGRAASMADAPAGAPDEGGLTTHSPLLLALCTCRLTALLHELSPLGQSLHLVFLSFFLKKDDFNSSHEYKINVTIASLHCFFKWHRMISSVEK